MTFFHFLQIAAHLFLFKKWTATQSSYINILSPLKSKIPLPILFVFVRTSNVFLWIFFSIVEDVYLLFRYYINHPPWFRIYLFMFLISCKSIYDSKKRFQIKLDKKLLEVISGSKSTLCASRHKHKCCPSWKRFIMNLCLVETEANRLKYLCGSDCCYVICSPALDL